jgi:hypothetical protein
VDLLPAKVYQLRDPQGMAEGHQDQQTVAARVTALASGGQELLDFGLGQIFALPVIGILGPTTTNCRLFRL